jgi:hypothetical protein
MLFNKIIIIIMGGTGDVPSAPAGVRRSTCER